MKKVVMLVVAASISAIAYAEGIDVFKNQKLSAVGQNGGEFVYLVAQDFNGNQHINLSGSGFRCYGDAANIDVHTTANYGTIAVNTANLICSGSPPTEVSAECISNGVRSAKGVSNGKTVFFGNSFVGHVNYANTTADCMIYVDGVLYDRGSNDGDMSYENSVQQ